MDELRIQMLGGFSLKLENRELQDTDTRSKKAWTMLAYLIVHRDQPVSQNKLIDLLWGNELDSSNPENALRITMHRTRGLLERIPMVGIAVYRLISRIKDMLKALVIGDNIFDAMGFKYVGPVDGHNVRQLVKILKRARDIEEPVLIHVVTHKGRGY